MYSHLGVTLFIFGRLQFSELLFSNFSRGAVEIHLLTPKLHSPNSPDSCLSRLVALISKVVCEILTTKTCKRLQK